MRRLVDYYWSIGDDASLAEIAHELDGRGELVSPDTSAETLSRVAISAALAGDARWGASLAFTLGDGGVGAIASVSVDPPPAARAPPTPSLPPPAPCARRPAPRWTT